MMVPRLLIGIGLVILVLSLVAVIGIVMAWVVVGLSTVAGAARRDRLRRQRLGPLRGQLAQSDLADIDETLERIFAQEYTGLTSSYGTHQLPP
ncbi:MAG TPA: hypothetical protein VF834_07395 [Streptosporangiaceae bacterium]